MDNSPKIRSSQLDTAKTSLRNFMEQSAADVTPGGRATVREVMSLGSQVSTALDLLEGRLTVEDVKITLSHLPDVSTDVPTR